MPGHGHIDRARRASHRRHRQQLAPVTGLVGLGAACLVGFLGLHYYSLALTLLQKSAVLVASGAVCLACAAFFRQLETGDAA